MTLKSMSSSGLTSQEVASIIDGEDVDAVLIQQGAAASLDVPEAMKDEIVTEFLKVGNCNDSTPMTDKKKDDNQPENNKPKREHKERVHLPRKPKEESHWWRRHLSPPSRTS